MNAKRSISFFLMAACLSTAAFSADDQFSDIDCSKEQESMIGMKFCAGKTLEKTEKILKQKRAQYLKKSEKSDQKQVRVFFKAADAYVDAFCDLEGRQYAGGSMQGVVISVCLDSEYKKHTKVIDNLLEGLENR